MIKVFSYSLYDSGVYYGGTKNKYTYNMIANILIAEKIFPDWKIYVYYDKTLKPMIINFLLRSPNVVAKDMSEHWLNKCDKMMWRNLAIDDDNLDVVCIRDCDGWLSYREKVLLEHWIDSDKELHIIRDHCWHGGKIGGGLWGRKKSVSLGIEEKMKGYFESNREHKSHSGEDQDFLTDHFYDQYKYTTQVYIGEQYNNFGVYLPKGHYPEECVIRINDLINYDEFINNKDKYEVIDGLSLIEVSRMNEFRCGRCSKSFHVFIGDMFNILPESALNVILDNLFKVA